MAADLAGLRAAIQQATEQLGQLVALGNRQVEAVERLAILIELSSDQ